MIRRLGKHAKRYRPRIEVLEERRVLSQFGVPWQDAQHLTISFAPDGTPVGGERSDLFQSLGSWQPTASWQDEILRAFQIWAVNANINFALKPDDGSPFGVPGPEQGDPRFGDIRIGAVPMAAGVLAVSVPHDPFLSGTWSGDILLNSNVAFDGKTTDLLPVMLHEIGHVLGLDESSDPTSVMGPHLDNQLTALSASDIGAVQALYPNGGSDASDGPSANDSLQTAASIPAPAGFDGTTPLLVYSYLSAGNAADFYSLTTPAGYRGPLTIRLQTAGVSFLAPHLTVYDASGTPVGDVSSQSIAGDTLQLTLPNVDPGATYDVRVAGARSDLFGQGEFALAVSYDGISTVGPSALDAVIRETYVYLSPDDINAIFQDPRTALFHDDHHTNDTFATATPLEPAAEYGANAPIRFTGSLGDPSDVDFYRFETPPAATSDGPGATVVMTVTVRATEVNGIMPTVAVFDQDRNPVPAVVLAHGDGTDTVQVVAATPDTSYVVRVGADPTSGKAVGNYEVEAGFGHVAAQPATFVAGVLSGPADHASYDLVVNQSQLFDFLLAASTPGSAPAEAVRMTLSDAAGRIVLTRSAGIGDTAGGDPILLAPGLYHITFDVEPSGGSVPASAPLTFRLYGASLTDPIGPALDDPTLSAAAGPSDGAPPTAPVPLVGSSGAPHFWLAQSLVVPSGSLTLQAPVAGSLDADNQRSSIPLQPLDSRMAVGDFGVQAAPRGAISTIATRIDLLDTIVLLSVGVRAGLPRTLDQDAFGTLTITMAENGPESAFPILAGSPVDTIASETQAQPSTPVSVESIGCGIEPASRADETPGLLMVQSLTNTAQPPPLLGPDAVSDSGEGSLSPSPLGGKVDGFVRESRIGPDLASTVATVWMAAMLYVYAHPRGDATAAGSPTRIRRVPFPSSYCTLQNRPL